MIVFWLRRFLQQSVLLSFVAFVLIYAIDHAIGRDLQTIVLAYILFAFPGGIILRILIGFIGFILPREETY